MNIKTLLSTTLLFSSFSALAQDAPKTFAITGNGAGDFRWMNIRQVDITTGKIVQDIYQADKTGYTLLDATTKKTASTQSFRVDNNGTVAVVQMQDAPTATMVAAAAYDKQHDKLFFTPMRIGELRWIDLSAKGNAPQFFQEKTTLLNPADMMDEANHITRMDIAADGNGYAITNDGNHLIRFTTGKKTVVTDLGNLVDAGENTSGVSIHNKCTSWGGDMVADAYGKLYVISAAHQVFKVDIETRITSYIGSIINLPANFTTNGAAVGNNNEIILSSANSFEGYYKITLDNLSAVKIEGSDTKYNSSDLANGNLLFQKEVDAKRDFNIPSIAPVAIINTDARVFPNPITANEFKVLFDGQKPGQYLVTLSDLSGRAVLSSRVSVSAKLQTQTVRITSTLGKGFYFVKVTDANNQIVFTEKVAVQ